MDLISMLIGFLFGTATGAAGKYFADKYTDQRKEKEATSSRPAQGSACERGD
jgi:hypothetical protein